MPAVHGEHITRVFGTHRALDGADFVMESGRNTVILGPSGAGKTTLLRCIAGLEKPDQGRIFFDDQDVTDLSPGERKIAMIFQNAALFERTRIRDNIAYGLNKLGYSRGEIDQMVSESASRMRIGNLLDRYPGMLSGGEKQRASIARALVRKPKILLLDEPFSSLDARLSEELEAEVLALAEQYRMTMIQVTHNQAEAMNMADRLIVMDRGRIRACGTPQQLYENPPDLFTAGFIGTPKINIIDTESNLFLRLKKIYHMGDNVKTVAVRPQNFQIEESEEGICEVTRTVSGYGNYEIHALCLDVPAVFLYDRPLEKGTRLRVRAEYKDILMFDEEGNAVTGPSENV